MPDYYEGEAVSGVEALKKEALDADRERRAIADLPMRNHNDARVMRDQLTGARALIEQTRATKDAHIQPLVAEVQRLESAYDKVIAAYRSCEALALERLEQMDHLHDFEVAKPSKSGFPPRPQRQSAAPRVAKKGRGRKRA